jgi:predicted nucleic acid-binding protein
MVSAAARDRAVAALNRDSTAWIVVELTAELAADAQKLLLRYDLRTGNALQLASCLYLQRETRRRLPLAAFDDRLQSAARTEGLLVIDFQ